MTSHQKRLEEIRDLCLFAHETTKAEQSLLRDTSWLLRAVERLEDLVPHGINCNANNKPEYEYFERGPRRVDRGYVWKNPDECFPACTCDRDKLIAECFESEDNNG